MDLATGDVRLVFDHCNGQGLRGPNDLVFDKSGGLWFTDHGKTRARDRDRTGVFYASPGLEQVQEVIFPLEGPNGIGLSATEDELYVAETPTGRVWAYALSAPGVPTGQRRLLPGRSGYFMFDSLAVDGRGRVCVATLIEGGITLLDPAGGPPGFVAMPDRLTTNICFGGTDLSTAFITLSATGQLVRMRWPDPGLPLNFLNH